MGFGNVITTPTQVDTTDQYLDIAAGNDFICGITTASKLKCFGAGLATSYSPRAIGFVPHLPEVWDADNFSRLNIVNNGLCAITTTGLPKCFFRYGITIQMNIATRGFLACEIQPLIFAMLPIAFC